MSKEWTCPFFVQVTGAVFRPRVLLVEAHERTVQAIESDPINTFVAAAGYRLIAKTLNTLIYEDGPQISSPNRAA